MRSLFGRGDPEDQPAEAQAPRTLFENVIGDVHGPMRSGFRAPSGVSTLRGQERRSRTRRSPFATLPAWECETVGSLTDPLTAFSR